MQESCKAKIGHTFNGQTGIVTDFFANRDLFKLICMYNLRNFFLIRLTCIPLSFEFPLLNGYLRLCPCIDMIRQTYYDEVLLDDAKSQ